MKKIRRFILVVGIAVGLLALRTASLAQDSTHATLQNIEEVREESSKRMATGIKLGTKTWWTQKNDLTLSTGIEGNFFIDHSFGKLSLQIGAGFGYFKIGETYTSIRQSTGQVSGYPGAITREESIISQKGCFYFTVPAQIFLTVKKVKPFIGIAFYDFATEVNQNSKTTILDAADHDIGSGEGFKGGLKEQKDMGLLAGVVVNLTKRIGLEAAYSHGLFLNSVSDAIPASKNSGVNFSIQYRWNNF